MRYILTPALLITLAIVFAPLVPRIAAAQATNFVTVLEVFGVLCIHDAHLVFTGVLDPQEELSKGILYASIVGHPFRGIMLADKAANRGLVGCGLPGNPGV